MEAARNLVLEMGFDRVTVSEIAAAAGASKQTLYKRWPSKAELVLDAFLDQATKSIDEPMAAESGKSVEEVVSRFLLRTFTALERSGPALRGLMGHAQTDPQFCSLFKSRLIEVRRKALRTVIVNALDGSHVVDGRIDATVVALFGALWYRLLLNEPLSRELARELAFTVAYGLLGTTGARKAQRISRRSDGPR